MLIHAHDLHDLLGKQHFSLSDWHEFSDLEHLGTDLVDDVLDDDLEALHKLLQVHQLLLLLEDLNLDRGDALFVEDHLER